MLMMMYIIKYCHKYIKFSKYTNGRGEITKYE